MYFSTSYPEMKAFLPDKVKFYLKRKGSTKRGPAELSGEKVTGTNSRSS